MFFQHTRTWGFEGAFRGMRNPMDSWDKADSQFGIGDMNCDVDLTVLNEWSNALPDDKIDERLAWLDNNGITDWDSFSGFIQYAYLGPKDLGLAQRLIQAGNEHAKFLRMIHVQTDITAPRYIWSEFDTYHFNTKNSCSTMHRLLNKQSPISIAQFQFEPSELEEIEATCDYLNILRDQYLASTDSKEKNKLLARAKSILPEGFLQYRTVDTNYAELRTMYFQRRNHRLEDWNTDFVTWVDSLPYAKELIEYECV